MAEVRFQVLDVGQGSGNFVEIYTDSLDKVLGATILVDLGTERDPGDAAQNASIEYVRKTLASMSDPTINLLVLSHSDTDHINLIATLLSKFTPPGQPATLGKPNLTILNAWYAGEYAKFKKRRGTNVLVTVGQYMLPLTAPLPYSTGFSSFRPSPPSAIPPCLPIGDVFVYTLVANVVNEASKAAKESPHWVNTRSAVLLISYVNSAQKRINPDFTGAQYVVTGDATGNTLYEINSILENMGEPARSTYLPNVFMLTAPHHGSETTTFDLLGLGRGNKITPEANVETFSNFIRAKCLSASAERVTTFKHPAWSVITALSGHLGKDGYFDPYYPIAQYGEHCVTIYVKQHTFARCPWPAAGNFYSFNTESNIFTNLYCVRTTYYDVTIPPNPVNAYDPAYSSAPPYCTIALGATWEFRINELGAGFVSKMDNRSGALATPFPPRFATPRALAQASPRVLAQLGQAPVPAPLVSSAIPVSRLAGLRQLS